MDRAETIVQLFPEPLNDDEVFIEDFVECLKLRGSPISTWRNHRSRLRMVANYLHAAGYSFTSLDKEALKKTLICLKAREHRGKPISEKAISNIFSILSSFCSYLAYMDRICKNPIPDFKKHYLSAYKKDTRSERRKLLNNEEMAELLNSTLNPLSRAIMALFAKTGIRRGELIAIDLQDVNFEKQSIMLKPKRKRSNRLVFFDDEAAFALSRWLRVRGEYANDGEKALFVGKEGGRIGQNIVYNIVTERAASLGFHNPESLHLEDHFSPHCFRHWFTTSLRQTGMRREFIQELRGDSKKETIDIYDHIDPEELRKEYLRCIPRLGLI